MKTSRIKKAIENGLFDNIFKNLYGEDLVLYQCARYKNAVISFENIYGNAGEDSDVSVFSVPGRTEVSGNHTDHNNGCVLAAAVNLDIIAIAQKTDDNIIRIKSEGFCEDIVSLDDIKIRDDKKFTSAAIIAGVCDGFMKEGFLTGGFNAYTTNDVAKGSGLSSSAAFEVMCGNILNHLYNNAAVSASVIAKISQYAENEYFGKPCGLMDQTACAVGGFVEIDFFDSKNPVINKMSFDLQEAGYNLCITNTGGNHADLNDDYASVPAEMKAVADYFGKNTLRGIEMNDILQNIQKLREINGDRAILRALHFINENKRVNSQAKALRSGDFSAFLDEVNASGKSSFMWLQNVYTTKNIREQGISLALAISEAVLSDSGKKYGVRVHGGGFAGTIAAFVPNEYCLEYKKEMESVFGQNTCMTLKIREAGAIKIDL